MQVLAKMFLALAVVGVLATILANSVVPLVVVAAVAYATYHVWLGLNG